MAVRAYGLSNRIFRNLDTVGDGSGTKSAAVNGSVTAVPFLIAPPTGRIFQLTRIIGHIEDAGVPNWEEYGNLGAALTNGITLAVQNSTGGVLLDLLDGMTIKSNADWGHYCYDVFAGERASGNNQVQFRWTFSKAGAPLELNGDNGDRLVLTVQDDLTGLVDHFFQVQGLNVGI